ncbi:hypothetical protein [Alkalicoccus chagannorensis]|uniref:hypothetical protein n=1 Tax=Alkalicoccus chagannorensis TaxID=427072 RepID=UPI00041587CF|nr:hypothetical protein [Alkalicoccus chagannorensis]
MRKAIIGIILFAAGCSAGAPPGQTESSAGMPLIETVEQSDLTITHLGTELQEDTMLIHFLAENNQGHTVASDDYQFQWPSYIRDSEDVTYEVKDTSFSHSSIMGQDLGADAIGMTIEAGPLPADKKARLEIPFYMIPSVYDSGYTFEVADDTSQLRTGDIALRQIEAAQASISFTIDDDHPDADSAGTGYVFTRMLDGETIYPIFRSVEQRPEGTHITADFSMPFTYPETFVVERTAADLPEWRFSMVVPIEEEDEG